LPDDNHSKATNKKARLRLAAGEVASRLRQAGYEAYFAGGSVRDMLLGQEPDDIDIATSARPEDVMALFRKTVPVGEAFGVVVVLHGGFEFQVATFRADGAYIDGRRPKTVHFSSAKQDVERRDFTINGMLSDPMTNEILDWVGGRQDLDAGIVRAIGEADQRFAEDRLRLLRAVRFAARFDFRIHPETWNALVERAPEILMVSWERIRDELLKMFSGPNPHRALILLEEAKLLQRVLPEVAALKGLEQPPEHHPEGDVFTHVRLMLEQMDRLTNAGEMASSPELGLAVLLHDTGKAVTQTQKDGHIHFYGHEKAGAAIAEDVCRRLRLSRQQARTITALVADHMKAAGAALGKLDLVETKKLMRQEHFPMLLDLLRLDCLGKNGDDSLWARLKRRYEETGEKDLWPRKLLTGADLKDMGLAPGPLFKEILEALEDAQLAGTVTDRDQALALARGIARKQMPGRS